jgi:hypothetical protein
MGDSEMNWEQLSSSPNNGARGSPRINRVVPGWVRYLNHPGVAKDVILCQRTWCGYGPVR